MPHPGGGDIGWYEVNLVENQDDLEFRALCMDILLDFSCATAVGVARV